jgi:cytochrome P450
VPRASVPETLAVVTDVLLPHLARGIIIRRPRITAFEDHVDADRRAVRRLQRLHDRHGQGPVLLAIPGRKAAVVLDADDVRRVLAESPEPFATANREKRAALSHFQPHGVLISHGPERVDRRRFNEAVLDTPRPVHELAEALLAKVHDEAQPLVGRPLLSWDQFAPAWWRMVRRVVLGDGARDDEELTDMLARLRRDANWAFMKPKRTRLRRRFLERVDDHLGRAEPGSLAALVASAPTSAVTYPADQVSHWLFAFDAAGMAAFRTLALLDAHPREAADAREEIVVAKDLRSAHDLPFLRACVLESVRLWPTTRAILRDTTGETTWATGTLPGGTALLIHTPFFDRNVERLEFADRFVPELWLGGQPEHNGLVPFSDGPAMCPGRNLVLLLTSSLLAVLLAEHDFSQPGRRLDASRPLPATLSPFGLRFEVRRRR